MNVDRIAEILRDQFRFVSESRLGEIAAEIDAELHPVIETVEQLDALPNGSVVLDSEDGSWQRAWGFWYAGGNRDSCPASDVWLPARVLWTPEVDR
ncbi:hypothetical protein BA059_16765 [Mycolicibacterium sp. (ex Dasyatis americana)]|nr:hypothetical protein BA059_16765 [Mycolicibacterium sp. (ex Dasyatis americana)]